MAKKKVAIDAGHGGFGVTPGKRSPANEYEWNFNNKVAVAAIAKLVANGVEVIRVDDPTGKTDVPLTTRTNKANAAKVDLYVSLHHNANTGVWGTWTGVETFTYIKEDKESIKAAKEVHSRVVKAMGLFDRGLKRENFHVLRETDMPALLVEGGYMDSQIDIRKMRDDKVMKGQGEAVAEGILAYLDIEVKKEEVKTEVEVKPAPKPAVESAKADVSDAGKRAESIYAGKEGLNFYSRASWDAKYKVGAFMKGDGWTIRKKISVEGADMFEVKNSKGAVFYITASAKYVKVVADAKPAVKPAPAKEEAKVVSGIKIVGEIQIVNVANAAIICDKPSSTNSKDLGLAKKGSKLPISGSVPGWYEVVYKGKRCYVNAKYAKRV